MFAKAYKHKSNNTLKNSEKKHLAQRIQDEFPAATEEKVKELVPVKSNSSCMKLVLHSGETVGVYVVDGVPMMIDLGERLVPTVCALWKVPDLVPTVVIHSPVLSKVLGGAPLYLPGVVTPAGGIGFPRFARGDILAAKTQDNAAAALVGRTPISSGDYLLRAAGACLEPLHVFGDLLCKEPKFTKIERPKMGPASYGSDDIPGNLIADVTQLSIQQPLKEEWPSLGKPAAPAPAPVPTPAPVPNEPQVIADEPPQELVQDSTETEEDDTILTEDSQLEEDPIPTNMDGLLQWCLLSFLKLEGKSIQLPLKTNLLYKNHLIPLCPPDRTLDVKKSTYKKMGKFLEAMQKEGLIEVREVEKGVDAVVAVQPAHPLVRVHAPPDLTRLRAPEPQQHGDYTPPLIREMFCITAIVAPLFVDYKKGTALTSGEIRTTLTEYIKSHNLDANAGKGCLTLDPLLAKVTGKPEQAVMKWDELMSTVQGKFTPSTEMRFSDGTVKLTKSKLEPIKMQVASRSGNKKVTLVSNLEAFGFNLAALSHVCQVGVAASCGVTRSPGAKADQLMLQGDQTHFVAKLLIEKFGLPKKFVDGADKALKKKK